MNENIDLTKILKDCPKGTKLYSPVFGDVELYQVIKDAEEDYHIDVILSNNTLDTFTKDGRLFAEYDGECTLFPSKEQRDWSKFKPKKQKFDPQTLNPFDKVLARDNDTGDWKVQLFSHIKKEEEFYPYVCINESYTYCIPYNNDTKHLVGTTEEAPEFYRYWNK